MYAVQKFHRKGICMGTQALLINALSIFVSIFFYQILWLDKDENKLRNDWLVSLLTCSTLLLCLTFPYELTPGFIYDLRLIPILLCFLYGSNLSRIIISLVYIAYRYYLGGDGFYTSILSYSAVLPVLLLISSKYATFSKKKKVSVVIIFVAIWTTLSSYFISTQLQLNHASLIVHIVEHYALYILILSFTLWLSIYLIEGMIENRMRKLGLKRKEKINLLGDLASSIAHEIRNPLTVVSGFMQLLIKDHISDQNKKEYFHLMISELNQAESIITNYLSLTKKDAHHQEQPVNVISLIQQVIEVINPYAIMNNVDIRFSSTVPIYLSTNPIKIKQCLINIIKNGIEAMVTGGILYIKTNIYNDKLIVDIIDSGTGMTEEEVNRLGLPFYSIKEKGTGLGTMISYSIIESMNGQIKVQSEKGKGTSFSISIPLKLIG